MNEFLLKSDILEISERIQEDAKAFSDKKIILTGARGFLGRYFIEIFKNLNNSYLNKPVQVFAVDNFKSSGKAGSQLTGDSQIKLIDHDVITPIEFDEKIDYIINAAGIASPKIYKKYPLETLEVSISGTKNMLEIAKKNQSRITFFSSSEIYGDPDSNHIPTTEDYRGYVSSQGPRACYDEGKRVGETLCYIYHEYFGVKTTIVRPFNFFGPGMQEQDYRVLPNFGSKIKSNKPLEVYGTGNQTRTFCYITDAITGLFKAILKGKPGETYNIGNPKPEVSVMDLVKRISQVLKREIPLNVIDYPDEYPSNEPNRRCPSIEKAIAHLGYEPKVELNEGLSRFLSWTEENYVGMQ